MIGLVFVLYNPKPDDLAHVYAIAQKYAGVVVDNSHVPSFFDEYIGKMKYIPMHKNAGIASAQNVGIRHLLQAEGVTHVVFFDQDSRFPMSFPEDIVQEYERIRRKTENLAILGPSVVNSDDGEEYHSVIHKDTQTDTGLIMRREIISSGSVVATDVLRCVGPMREDLFIDFVDFEWCWRAESKGYVCGITRNVTLNHHVGQGELKIGTYRVIVSSPQRYYYQYRNHLWLCCRSYVPLQWKITTGIKHIARLIYLPWLVNDGMRVWKNMLKGIADSFR